MADNRIRDGMEAHFSYSFCIAVEQAIKNKFPNIKNLSAEMDEQGTVRVTFEETEYSQKDVESFLDEIRKQKIKP